MNPAHPDDDFDRDRDRDRSRNSRDDDTDRDRRGRDRDDDYDRDRDRDRRRDRYDDYDDFERRRGRDRDYQDSNLSAGEWLVAIICSTIGCIIGIIWLIQGNPKGGKMLGFSILFDVIKSVIYLAVTEGKGLKQ